LHESDTVAATGNIAKPPQECSASWHLKSATRGRMGRGDFAADLA